ncbi:MAG: hypothetical protein ABI882_02745 [Acidobacteriota bacterium]
MYIKEYSSRILFALSLALALTAVIALGSHSDASAQGKKEFKGATVEGNKLVVKPGFKLREVGNGRVETFREEPSEGGPTARRVSKPIRVDGINIKCVCGGTTSGSNCTTTVTSGGATCSVKNNSCSRCDMIATE